MHKYKFLLSFLGCPCEKIFIQSNKLFSRAAKSSRAALSAQVIHEICNHHRHDDKAVSAAIGAGGKGQHLAAACCHGNADQKHASATTPTPEPGDSLWAVLHIEISVILG